MDLFLNLLMPVGPLIDKRPDSFCDNLFHEANFGKIFMAKCSSGLKSQFLFKYAGYSYFISDLSIKCH